MSAHKKIAVLSLAALTALAISCRKNTLVSEEAQAPAPSLPEVPYNYSASNNNALATLGRVLFYDKSLSRNNSISCAGCHQQEKAFCDNQKFSVGLEDVRTARNSPSIFSKSGRMFWDGRAANIGDLVLRPLKNHIEMKFENLAALSQKISGISYYPGLFKKAFGTEQVDSVKIRQALSEFLRNFNFSNNKFNRSEAKKETLSATEEIGRKLFFSKALCSNCHHIQSNRSFPGDSTGVSGYGSTNSGFNIGLELNYADKGVGEISGRPEDDGVFMVPALLNVEYTAPYMHDGRYKTLEEVVEHYNSGIKNHRNLSFELRDAKKFEDMPEEQILALLDTNHNGEVDDEEMVNLPVVKLGLSTDEKRCLVAFLRTLSDPSILTEPRFSNPFALK